MAYSLRSTAPSGGVLEILKEGDDALRRALERIVGASVDEQAWRQAGLKSSDGGMGLRHMEDIALPAFIGSSADTSGIVLQLLGRTTFEVPGLVAAVQNYSAKAGSHVSMSLGVPLGRLQREGVSLEACEGLGVRSQSSLQTHLDSASWEDLKNAATANSKDRLEATRRPRAGAWLAAFPTKSLGLWIAPSEFQAATCTWLGLLSREENRAMLKQGAAMHGRHHALRDVLFEAGRSANLRPRKEVMVDSSGQRPADVYFPDWSRGRPLAIDVTVSHPSQSTTSLRARGEASASERAAERREAEKERRYKAKCGAKGVDFLAAAVCCFGGWLGDSEAVVGELADRIAYSTGLAASVAKAQLWQQLSIALWRGNARLILRNTGCW